MESLSQKYRATKYRIADSLSDLEHKRIISIFPITNAVEFNDHKSAFVIVTDAALLFLIDGEVLPSVDAFELYSSMFYEVEQLTGIRKEQLIYTGLYEGVVPFDYDHLKRFVESDTLSPEWLKEAEAWHKTPREVPDWYKKLGPDPQVKMKW